MTKKDISLLAGVSEDTALRELKTLIKHRLISKHGTGKSTAYTLKE